MRKILPVLIAILLCNGVFGQIVIDYSSWNPSSPSCNIFSSATAVPATTGGSNTTVSHLTNIGEPAYNATSHSIDLNCSYTSSGASFKGTQYQISNNFQLGYSYEIKVNAAVINSGNTGSNASLVLNLNSGGNGNNNQCNGVQTISSSTSGNLIKSSTIAGTTYSDYTFAWAPLSAAQSFLTVGAVCPSGSSNSQTILIKRITITVTGSSASFTLSPGSLSVTCGTTVSQTFTINNANSTPGVTSYTWNLGANNGWIYNGSPAPSSITTTTNTINLSSSCAGMSNISASAAIGSTNYNTNTSTITNALPALSVSGAAFICSGTETYSVVGLPCAATVSWSASPSGYVSLTPVGNQASVQRSSGYSGNVTLTAAISNACGNTTSVQKQIATGTLPASSAMFFNGVSYGNYATDLCVDAGLYYDVSITPVAGATSYSWQIDDPLGVVTVNYGLGTNLINVTINGAEGSPIIFSVQAVNGCGNGVTTQVGGEICGSIIPPRFAAFPNPTAGEVEIEAKEENSVIRKIEITDKYGNLKKKIRADVNSKKQKISIRELPSDIYVIRIYDGKTWVTKKVIKR